MNITLKALLAAGEYEKAAYILSDLEGTEVLTVFSELSEEDTAKLCRYVESELLTELILGLGSDKREAIVDALSREKLEEATRALSVDERLSIMEGLSAGTAHRLIDIESTVELIVKKMFAFLKAILAEMNEIDIAALFDGLPSEDRAVVFRLLSKDVAAEVFVELSPEIQSGLIGGFTDAEVKRVIDELFIDDVVDLIEEMPANVVKRILIQSDKETRAFINEILRYPKDSTGSIMTVEYVALSPEMTVNEAFERIRKTAIDKETVYTCYVTDKTNHLLGAVTAKDLLISSPEALVEGIMNGNPIYANTLDDREYTARRLSDYGFLAIPVVDDERRLVGIVTVDDAMDVLREENTEDIAKMAATLPSDKPYIKTGVFSVFKNRIPWLLLLMVSATFTGLIINTYEERLNAISSVLFACVPMLMDTGGNAGSQASVTVIRALALGEIKSSDVFKVIWKELRVSVLAAITLGIACMAKLLLIDNLLFGFDGYTPVRCAVVSAALALTVILAKFTGCVLPLLAKKLKLDPAVVASPFITTIVDAVSLMVYCSLAINLL